MEEIEDFKYEFDLAFDFYYGTHKDVPMVLFNGYLCLHQLIKNDLGYMEGKLNIYQMFDDLLSKDESFTENDGKFELKINNLNEINLDYIKFLLNCCLVTPKNIRIENNLIKWEVENENN